MFNPDMVYWERLHTNTGPDHTFELAVVVALSALCNPGMWAVCCPLLTACKRWDTTTLSYL